ncbi:hypothetical protein ONZ43_g5929 [Nemania bipapillata]|uniref:Uncharacterized protein n=1 Tax=Nemania bipapillata TaxID=110536 RepID=A0ACC2I5L8_9PEZI|nr:hypothetical protein ONZ43_g5929 [Nemania bipapillata]
MASTPGRTPRILACVLANVTCTPSTPAPPRKRRRPNQDLQQRLARCEELLSEYTTNPRTPPNDPPSHEEPWRPMGKLVIDDDGTKFTDSHLWATVHNEISAMREILEDDETIEEYCTPVDSRTPEHNTSLVLSEGTDANVEEYRPSPAHAFRLWQTFLEKVNPLTKVVHVPSVQPKLVEATTNPGSIPKNVEALLFSIYAVAVAALDERECRQQLGCAKEEAYQRFSTGCRIALMRIGILNTYDLVVLQALVLYFFSLSGRVDRHAAWILNGVTVRIAQKMGLHRDVCYEVAKMIIDTPNLEAVVLGNETGMSDAAPPEVIEKARRRIHKLDETIGNILDNYCDPSMGPIHELAAEMRHLLIGKCRELICPAKDQPEWGIEIYSPGDNLFKISVVSLEMDVGLYRMAQAQGQYLWFMLTQFQIEMMIYMTGQLSERTTGSLVERAWVVVEQHYGFHEGLTTILSKTHLALAILVVRGWKARETTLRKMTGSVPTTPEYILKLQALVPSTEAKHTRVEEVVEAANIHATTNRPAQQGIGMPWDQMLGFDVGALDWDMFAGSGENLAVNPAGYAMGFVGQQSNSWM